ncbi:MAG: hypothetical protein M3R06_02560 [Chloroflexota bacterium]|nr:hypothetical protein [Chloroflexota bacterium]
MSEPPPPAASFGRPKVRPHILVVTDDASLSVFLAEGLLYGGFWTSVIASGLQALEVFRLRDFDLIIVDADLGGIGAIETIQRLRGLSDRAAPGDPRTDAPIVLVTEQSSDVTTPAHIWTALNVVQVLTAPLELEVIAPRLHAILERWDESQSDRDLTH